jgi:hypothetical protein
VKRESKIIIKAVKSVIEEDIEVDAFKNCTNDKEIKRGVFLDTRK